jgi:hypothetical protein
LTIGSYGPGGLSLSKARERCVNARQAVEEGRSPAQEKQRDKRRIAAGETFVVVGKRWLKDAPMADSTRAMRGRSSTVTSSRYGKAGGSPRSRLTISGRSASR